MPSQGDWKAICIRKKSGIRLNHGVIKNLAARFGIVQSIKDTSDILFINFNKITNINACIDEFRHNGFNVEESKRNKMQTNGNSSQTSNESSFSSPCLPLNQNASSVIGSSVPPNLSNFSTLNTKTGHCVLCQKNTVLVCQRCTDFYCSVECQLKDWHSHRFICFPMPKLVDVSQLQSEFHHAYNVALPHLIQNPLAPVIFEEPKNNTFMNQSRHPDSPARNSRNKNQSEAMTNSPKPNDCNNNASKMNNNATKKNNNSNDKGSNKQSSKENISSPVSEEAKKSTPPNSSKSIISNPLLTKGTNEIKEKLDLERLKMLKSKGSSSSSSPPVEKQSDEEDAIDANVLSFLKNSIKQNKELKQTTNMSRSSSMRSVCSSMPAHLKGTAPFPENNSHCLIVKNNLIQSFLWIRSLTGIASKEYNEIIDLIHEQGKHSATLEKIPKEGDQVLYLKDCIFYRSVVVSVVSDNEMYLYLIDTGEEVTVAELIDLKYLPSEFKKLKQYIFNVKLRNCSGTFGQSAQQYINHVIDNNVQVRLQYSYGTISNPKSPILSDVVCDLYEVNTNKHINEHLKSLQEEDDC